ncbi:MAG: ribosome-associated translation inhibitor RaiA [Myxococcales bacterium]|jgi:putative sigma-54 modulation protein|nr:ribosome-associated translation inhibitor RaiA [Myxococcales bacterium]
MNVTITFRHMEPSEAIKEYARNKVSKLQKHLRQPMTARVTLSLDKLEHSAEVQVASGRRRVEAKEVSDDTYASIDAVLDKLERQVRGSKGATQAKRRRSGQTLRNGRNPAIVNAPVAMAAGEST